MVRALYSTFERNYGGVFALTESTLLIHSSIFVFNEADRGGVIYSYQVNKLSISESKFTNNLAGTSGGVLFALQAIINISNSQFRNNRAGVYAGVLEAVQNSVTISGSMFINNSATNYGGVIVISYVTIIISNTRMIGNAAENGGAVYINQVDGIFNGSKFAGNVAIKLGAVMFVHQSNVNITGCMFIDNTAHTAGVLYIQAKSLIFTNFVAFKENIANQGSTYLIDSTGHFGHGTDFSDNKGSLLLYYSTVTFAGVVSLTNCMPKQSNDTNLSFLEGGAVTAIQSDVFFKGNSFLMYNFAEYGGGILSISSKLHMHGSITLFDNHAVDSGGGIYLYQSELNCINVCMLELIRNTATDKGGGIHAISSIILAEYNYKQSHSGSRVSIIANGAGRAGGGVYLEVNAKLKVLILCEDKCEKSEYTFIFTENFALRGGAVYVADNTNSGTCASISFKTHSTTTECFIQTITTTTINNNQDTHSLPFLVLMKFLNNHANVCGQVLFGGLFDRCTLSPLTLRDNSSVEFQNALTYFKSISNLTNLNSISSDPVRVCLCNGGQPDCSYKPPPVHIKKGENFTVTLAALDQVKTVVSAIIYSSLKFNGSGIGEGQHIQSTSASCTDLTFNVYSPNDFEELIVYANGPCKDAKLSQAGIQIQFSPCSCPIGFQQKTTEKTKCACECDIELENYITNCDPQTETVLREGNFWISVTNRSSRKYLIYPYCPLDYCHPSSLRIMINLNTANGADAQCANNRSGILCSSCKRGLSLSLGSSRCIVCPSYWPALLISILIAAFLAGIALVTFLLVLNLTVAVGTLNGIIFYANIINANSSIFLQFKNPNVITVFIMWLNLDLGFDTCFFEGMDAYWKTLLQLAFPVYLVLLVAIVTIVSDHSTRFARIIGKKNPVTTLATLIMLSYTKLLHIIIASLSFAILDYQDGSREVVWLPDATVDYLIGKHVVLFLIAVFILMAGIVYTALLFSWQWLLHYQNKKLLKWVRYQRLYMFLEPYHAPYIFKHRYWTGLLLFVRAILYIISAANVSNDPGVNLLGTGIVITGLLVMKGFSQGSTIYKSWFLDIIEVACFVNIILLCLAEFFSLQRNRNRTTIAYISGSFTLALFLIILAYHVFTELLSKAWTRFKKSLRQNKHNEVNSDYKIMELAQPTVTHSEVSIVSPNRQLPLAETSEVSDHVTSTFKQEVQTQPDPSPVKKSASYHLMNSS